MTTEYRIMRATEIGGEHDKIIPIAVSGGLELALECLEMAYNICIRRGGTANDAHLETREVSDWKTVETKLNSPDSCIGCVGLSHQYGCPEWTLPY